MKLSGKDILTAPDKDNKDISIFNAERYLEIIENSNLVPLNGRVTQVIGLVIESTGPKASMGEICEIITGRTENPVMAEVVGFKENRVLLMPVGDLGKISPGCPVISTGKAFSVEVCRDLLGRVLNGFGIPIDGKGKLVPEAVLPVVNRPPSVLERRRISEPLALGVRAIDSLLTVGKGQRVGIFAGSGVGKSTLMGMIARNTVADVNIIALIGERGREVREFIEKDLGEEGLRKSVVVAVTSDEPALVRIKGAYVATTIAEYFRSSGLDVNLMLDSITRFCMARREVGLSVGEPPTAKGYPPSVFAELPKILERAGMGSEGSITGLYTVLVEGDDMNEPVSDAVMSILDGHIILSRDLANMNHYPPIDVLSSVSRLMPDIVSEEQKKLAREVVNIMATYKKSSDLIEVGAYVNGTNPVLDHAIRYIDSINDFLKQDIAEKESFESGFIKLKDIIHESGVTEKETAEG
ncbi:MAG: flagellar protein export ATPase FliI [Actinobacteria bacterium]|nr:flagellar protein export ATPase FliI [Actinomycetota bacterium]